MRWLRWGILLVWFLLVVEALLPQMEVVLTGGTVPVPTVVLKFALLAIGLAAVIVRRRFELPHGAAAWWYAFVACLLVAALVQAARFGYSLTYLLFGHNAYYFFLLIVPLAMALRGVVPAGLARNAILVAFVPLAGLGIAQHLLRDPIVAVGSADQYLVVHTWRFHRQVRGFSLFTSGMEFGHYVALAAGIAVALLWRGRRWARACALGVLALAAASGYATLTRATYLEIVAAVAAAVALLGLRGRFRRLLPLLPVLFGIVGVLTAFVAPVVVSSLAPDSAIFSPESLRQRHQQWDYCLTEWLGRDVLTALFGTGFVQTRRFEFTRGRLIDNSFVAVGVHVGLVGLVLWLGLMWQMWRYTLRQSIRRREPLFIAAAALWSTWVLSGIYNINMPKLGLVLILLLFADAAAERGSKPAQGLSTPEASTAA